MKVHYFSFLFSLLLFSCSNYSESLEFNNSFSQKLTSNNTPRLLMPINIATTRHEHSGIFSSDMKDFYFTVSDTNYTHFSIKKISLKDEKMLGIEIASFSGIYSDHAVSFSPDGQTRLFSSTRPDKISNNWNIWSQSKTERGWSEPKILILNDKENLWTSHASLSKNRNMYFQANYEKGGYHFDIYKAAYTNGKYDAPQKLGKAINSDMIEITPYIAPDESYLIYASYERLDEMGDGDLYISFKREDQSWSMAINMGNTINTSSEESNPYVTPDGKHLVFSSKREVEISENHHDRSLNIFIVSTDIIKQLKIQSEIAEE